MNTPNEALATQVYNVLKPLLGRYSLNGVDKGKAWFTVRSGALSLAEGIPAGTRAEGGLEAVFGLYPNDYTGQHEFSDSGIVGVLHYPLTVKSYGDSTWPARSALITEFPLLTTNLARPIRTTPETDISWETMQLFIPIQTD